MQRNYFKILFIFLLLVFTILSNDLFCQINIDTNLSKTKEKSRTVDTARYPKNTIQIDTATKKPQTDTANSNGIGILDSLNKIISEKNTLSNTKIFLYILLSLIGLALFFFFFVMTLFKYFHKTKSSRQSMLLSWNLFMIFSLIWIFIIWGLLGGLWNNEFFSVIILFLFVVGLIMTIFSIKSK